MVLLILAAGIGIIGAFGIGTYVSNYERNTKVDIRKAIGYPVLLVMSIATIIIVGSVRNHASVRYIESIEVPLNDVTISTREGDSYNNMNGSGYVAKIAIYRSEAKWYSIVREKYEIVSVTRK